MSSNNLGCTDTGRSSMSDQPYLDGYAGPYNTKSTAELTALIEKHGAQVEALKRAARGISGFHCKRYDTMTTDGHTWLLGLEFHTELDWVVVLIPRVGRAKGESRCAARAVGLYSVTDNQFAADDVLRKLVAAFNNEVVVPRREIRRRRTTRHSA